MVNKPTNFIDYLSKKNRARKIVYFFDRLINF